MLAMVCLTLMEEGGGRCEEEGGGRRVGNSRYENQGDEKRNRLSTLLFDT